MEHCDTVFHLAASVGNARSIARPVEDAEINLIGTLHVLEAAKAAGVGKIVFSSSAAIFGELRHLPIDESHPVEPDSPYGASKLAAEKVCLAYGKLYGIEVVCLRYFNVYGMHQRYDAYGNVIPIFVRYLLRSLAPIVYGDGEQTRDFVNVRDVVLANLLAASTTRVHGAFNIASGTAVTINTVVTLLQQATGSHIAPHHTTTRPGDVRHSLADISAAGEAFGYIPTRVTAIRPPPVCQLGERAGGVTRVLVLGGSGMLGHKLWQLLRQQFDTWITLRGQHPCFDSLELFDVGKIAGALDAMKPTSLSTVFAACNPHVVINAIGIVKQRTTPNQSVPVITVNALFPHQLLQICSVSGSRLIHISTDCVYSGRKGGYVEADSPDAAGFVRAQQTPR